MITDVNQYRLDLIKKILPRVITINVEKESISRDMMKSVGIFEGFDIMRSGKSGKIILNWEN